MRTHTLKRSTKNRWLLLSILALVIVLGAAGYYYYTSLQASKAAESTIQTATIGTGDIILSATGLGTLIPSEEVSFGFKNGGQVAEVLVSLGEQVEAGQTLALLESSILEIKYRQAEAELAALKSQSAIAAAEQAVEDAKESLATAQDDLQLVIGPDMLRWEEKVAEAQLALQAAKATAENGSSAAAQQKVNEAEATLAKAKEELAWAQHEYIGTYIPETFTYVIRNSQGNFVKKQLFAPTDVEISVARAAYELAVANLKDAQNYLDVLKGVKTTDGVPASSVTAITAAQIAFDTAKANLEAAELVAPISGRITSIDLNAGETVGTSVIITISDLGQPYSVDAYLDETDWDKAKVGSPASVTFDLLPDQTYSAKVTRVYPLLDDSSGTAMVHILVQLDHSLSVELPSNTTASVEVVGGEALGAVLVPVSALKEIEPGKYIVYVMQNGQPMEQAVETGLQDILYAEVKSGLQAGDVVLTDATLNE